VATVTRTQYGTVPFTVMASYRLLLNTLLVVSITARR
jgi:hypothetical protein